MRRLPIGWTLFVLLLLYTGIALEAADWPQFYGPDRNNCSFETGLLKQWPEEGPKLLWKKSGVGMSVSPVSIADGRIYCVGISGDADWLLCLDEDSSELLWTSTASLRENDERYVRTRNGLPQLTASVFTPLFSPVW